MPFAKDRLFLEETSLVARPAVDFPELKRRLERRMAHYGSSMLSTQNVLIVQ